MILRRAARFFPISSLSFRSRLQQSDAVICGQRLSHGSSFGNYPLEASVIWLYIGVMSKSKSPAFNVREFFQRFPDDEACLTHIMEVRHGTRHTCRKCGVEVTFHRMTARRAYACSNCGDHVYPTAGTIFEDTRTPLQLWFYAIYLFCTTRHGVSGKELQRQLGVTYKTAWRMGTKIRELMTATDGFAMLQGHIEADEAYVGGRRPGKRGRGAEGKTIVMRLKERGARIAATVIPNVKKPTLRSVVLENVEKGSTVSTDELYSYGLLIGDGYAHRTARSNMARKSELCTLPYWRDAPYEPR